MTLFSFNVNSSLNYPNVNSGGSDLVFSTFITGTYGEDIAFGIALDDDGSICITGRTASSDFPTHNALYPSKAGPAVTPADAFVTKLNSDGSVVIYSTYLGGKGMTWVTALRRTTQVMPTLLA